MLKAEIRSSAYYDSVILMQLQRSLSQLPDVTEAGVVMGTSANKDVLAQSNLLAPEAKSASADDLIIVIDATTEMAATGALAQVDSLLQRKGNRDLGSAGDYRPKSLESATQMLPAAGWTMISTPGRYATGVANDALSAGKHVFLYSDNVSLADELQLKQSAAAKGLLVMGPDCGTAIVNGIGLGFANRVRRGPIGIVGASGTGLQQVTARIHELNSGITHAIGTGGRDLSAEIDAITARQALDLFTRDDATKVIVLISKPPSAAVAKQLLDAATQSGKPVVVNFIGYEPDNKNQGRDAEGAEKNVHFVSTLDATAELAVMLSGHNINVDSTAEQSSAALVASSSGRYLRGLFSGGTLAYETMLLLREHLPVIYSNAPLDKRFKLEKSTVSQQHTIIDLGEDEFTVGRLHPMMDNDLRIKRLAQEAADPETALILLDVVLGDGAHEDPAGELAPAIEAAIAAAAANGRTLAVHAIVVGTEEDPQGLAAQIECLQAAGAVCGSGLTAAICVVGEMLQPFSVPDDAAAAESTGATTMDPPHGAPAANQSAGAGAQSAGNSSLNRLPPVDLNVFTEPLAAINIGIDIFTKSLADQGAEVVDVEWKPPAGGNDKLAGILARMKKK